MPSKRTTFADGSTPSTVDSTDAVSMSTGKPNVSEQQPSSSSTFHKNDHKNGFPETRGKEKDGVTVHFVDVENGEENNNLAEKTGNSENDTEKIEMLSQSANDDTVTGGWRMDGNDTCTADDTVTKPLKREYRGYGAKHSKMNWYGTMRDKEERRRRMNVIVEVFKAKKTEWRLMAFVIFLFVLIIAGLGVIHHTQDHRYLYQSHNATVDEESLQVTFKNRQGQVVMSGTFWKNFPERAQPFDCADDFEEKHEEEEDRLCLKWKKFLQLEIRHYETHEGSTCHRVLWTDLSSRGVELADCFQLGDGHWYGGGLMKSGKGRLESTSVARQPLITGRVHDKGALGPIVEPHWLSSRGVAIIVSNNSTFQFSLNEFDQSMNATDGQICFYSGFHQRLEEVRDFQRNVLEYTICVGDSTELFRTDISKVQPWNLPDRLLDSPVWSTWSYFKDKYNQTILEKYADQIHVQGFGQSLLMLDDGWEEELGDLHFSTSKFHAPKDLIEMLKTKSIVVSLEVRLQISTASKFFQNSTVQDYLLRDSSEEVPGLSRRWTGPHLERWNRGLAGTIDVSYRAAAEWQKERMESLQKEHGSIYTFHLSGNEVSTLPADPRFRSPPSGPNEYTTQTVELMSTVGNVTITESASKCQHLPLVIRLSGATSTWNGTGGLQDVIPSVLTLGLLGYPAFIPDPVGGSASDGIPSRELYIRWVQVTSFFPIVHFSIPPKNFDDEVQSIVKRLLELRSSLVLPEVRRLVQSYPGQFPLVRPIWWLDPRADEVFQSVSEFLVGDNILVAPILEEGALQRSIYLPEGRWLDGISRLIHSGPIWLHNYNVSLSEVAYFIRR